MSKKINFNYRFYIFQDTLRVRISYNSDDFKYSGNMCHVIMVNENDSIHDKTYVMDEKYISKIKKNARKANKSLEEYLKYRVFMFLKEEIASKIKISKKEKEKRELEALCDVVNSESINLDSLLEISNITKS